MGTTYYYVQVNGMDCYKTDFEETAVKVLSTLLKDNKLFAMSGNVGIRTQVE